MAISTIIVYYHKNIFKELITIESYYNHIYYVNIILKKNNFNNWQLSLEHLLIDCILYA